MSNNRNKNKLSLEDIKKIIDTKVTGKIIPQHDDKGHHYKFVDSNLVLDSVTTINGWIAKHHLAYWAAGCAIDWLEKDNRIEELKGPNRENIILGAKKAHTDIRDDAGFVGTQAHNCIEEYLKEWIRTGERPSDIRLFFPHEQGETIFGFYLPDINITINHTDSRAVAAARAAEQNFIKMNIIPIASEILVGDPNFSAGTLDFLCLKDKKLTIIDFKTSNQIDKIGYPMQVAAYKYFFEHMTGLKVQQLFVLKISKDTNSFEEYKIPKIRTAFKAFRDLCSLYNNWISISDDEKIIRVKNRLKV